MRLPAGDEQRGLARDPSSSRRGRCCSTEASLVTSVNTSSWPGFLSMNKDDMGDGIPRINCRTTTATVLTTTATVTLSLRACLCFLMSPSPITSPSAAEAAQ